MDTLQLITIPIAYKFRLYPTVAQTQAPSTAPTWG